MVNGYLNLLGFKAYGTIIISVGASGFELVVPDYAPLSTRWFPARERLRVY